MSEFSADDLDASDATMIKNLVIMGPKSTVLLEALANDGRDFSSGKEFGAIIHLLDGKKLLTLKLLNITPEYINYSKYSTTTYLDVDIIEQIIVFSSLWFQKS